MKGKNWMKRLLRLLTGDKRERERYGAGGEFHLFIHDSNMAACWRNLGITYTPSKGQDHYIGIVIHWL